MTSDAFVRVLYTYSQAEWRSGELLSKLSVNRLMNGVVVVGMTRIIETTMECSEQGVRRSMHCHASLSFSLLRQCLTFIYSILLFINRLRMRINIQILRKKFVCMYICMYVIRQFI